jgi:signal transduction histidine kinase
VRLLTSALFWRILVSSLLVVAVLGWGLMRAMQAHKDLEEQFERLVQHDLKLADDAEVMLRLTADLETAKRGYLLVGDRMLLEPFDRARRDIVGTIAEARAVAEPGTEDQLIADFARDLDTWVTTIAEPRIRAKANGIVEPPLEETGNVLTDRMRVTLSRLRDDALAAAQTRERRAFEATDHARRLMETSIAVAIVLSLATGIWIARDTAHATAQIKAGLDATGRLEPLPRLPRRRDELGEVAASLGEMAELLREKDASLRATLVEREAAVENLTRANSQLRRIARELEEQGRALERANRVKTEFLAAMSHELRTPLSAILGFADLLLQSTREQLSPRARESLERIRRNGVHLLSLINDVLDLARAEAGRLEVRAAPCDVALLARACAAEVDSLTAGKELRLLVTVPRTPVEVSTDAQRLKQILINLLSNAIKFTEEGEVELSLQEGEEWIELAVRDSGMGIPAHAIPELFRAFHQLDVGDGRRFEGTGMGLALSRRLARALGGDIDVVSALGEGSTFRVRIPRQGIHGTLDAPATSEEMHA